MVKNTGKIKDFFDKETIKYLLEHFERLPKNDNGLRINANTMIEQDYNVRFRDKIMNFLRPHFPHLRISHATIYQDYLPGGIHTDGYIGEPEDDMSYTFLIPLESQYTENATVVFNESNPKAVSYNEATGLGNDGVRSYEQVDIPQGDFLSKEFTSNYLRHLSKDTLPLTLDSILYWQVGSALYWPRERFHSSAWFPKNSKRKAIVLLTNE